jgi:hypothetical protein
MRMAADKRRKKKVVAGEAVRRESKRVGTALGDEGRSSGGKGAADLKRRADKSRGRWKIARKANRRSHKIFNDADGIKIICNTANISKCRACRWCRCGRTNVKAQSVEGSATCSALQKNYLPHLQRSNMREIRAGIMAFVQKRIVGPNSTGAGAALAMVE